MGIKEITGLKPNDKIYHKHYGICKVLKLQTTITGELFGVQLCPETLAGELLLMYQSRMPKGTPLLETSYRLILCKIETEGNYYIIKIKK